MKKALLKILVLIVALCVSVCSLVACGGEQPSGEINKPEINNPVTPEDEGNKEEQNGENEEEKEEEEEEEEEHTHVFDKEVVEDGYIKSPVSCTEKAVYYKSCECGEKGEETFEVGEALSHSFTIYISNNDAKCGVNGTETANCDNGCGEKDSREMEGSALSHDYGDWIPAGNDKHKKVCSHDHTHVEFDDCKGGQATCTEKATCTDCDEKYGSTLPHEYTISKFDENGHWRECACSDKETATEHTLANRRCECGYKETSKGLVFEGFYNLYGVTGRMLAGMGTCTDTELIIPETYDGYPVVKIKESAFSGNTTIKSVEIPKSVSIIETDAFSYCTNLEKVAFEDDSSIRILNGRVFLGCTSLTSLYLPSQNHNDYLDIKWSSFSQCEKLVEIVSNANITVVKGNVDHLSNGELGRYAIGVYNRGDEFTGTKLSNENGFIVYTDGDEKILVDYKGTATALAIPDSITKINHCALYNRADITQITFEAESKLTDIGYNACYGTSITEIEIPATVKTIGQGAFDNCVELLSVVFAEENDLETLNGAFSNCTKLEEVDFANISNLERIFDFDGCPALASVKISNNVTEIGMSFYNKWNLTSVVFAEGNKITSIPQKAFESTKIQEIVIPSGVTSIGESAFNNCQELETVTFLSDNILETIGQYAFTSCAKLVNIDLPLSVSSVGVYAFAYCEKIESVTFGEALSELGYSAFNECDSLQTVTFNANCQLTAIADYTFKNSALSTINLPASVASIGEQAFESCMLSNIAIPSAVTSIGNEAFQYCTNLQTVTFGADSQLESIGNGAFNECNSLSSIEIPSSIKSIGSMAFAFCNLESSYYEENGLYYLGNSTNKYVVLMKTDKNITSAEINENCKFIYVMALSRCTSLTEVVIPQSVVGIDAYVFDGCTSLTTIRYSESVEDWAKVKKDSSWKGYNCPATEVICSNGSVSI